MSDDKYESDSLFTRDPSHKYLSVDPLAYENIYGAVPNSEIQEVIQDLRDGADEVPDTLTGGIKYRIRHELANELSKLLNEHTDE